MVLVSRNSCPAVSVTMFPPTKRAVTTAVLPSCPFSSTCVTPGFHATHIPNRTSAFLSLPAPGRFSCYRLQDTQGARPNTTAQVWALAEVRGTCSGGLKSKVTTGSHSEHVELSRPMQTHVQVNKMCDGSCDI